MNYMNDLLIYLLLSFLILSNLIFAFLLYKEKNKKSKSPTSSREADELLMDIMSGEALVKITRIAPNDVFLRSPRHGRN